MQQLTQIATPLLNTFSQGILQNPAARQALQDLTVTPNLEQLIQGLQNLTAITNPPVFSLLVRQLLSGHVCPHTQLKTRTHAHIGVMNFCLSRLLCSLGALDLPPTKWMAARAGRLLHDSEAHHQRVAADQLW